jgi:hypothetical protein
MATPKEALTGTNQTININNAKASPKNQAIGNQDTVTFKNNATNDAATITFLGAGANEFGTNPIMVAASGSSSELTPGTANVTVDYQITQGGTTGGLCSIEVGSGPLEIDIVDAIGNTNLEHAEIPNNGTVFFKNESTSQPASIAFSGDQNVLFYPDGTPVTSPVAVPANSSTVNLQGRGTNKEVSYQITMLAGQSDRITTSGNGSIKVGQT